MTELSILALSGILIIIVILIETMLAIQTLGGGYMSSPRDEKREKQGMTGRAERAVLNCTIGFALFAPAILILQAQDAFTANTLTAAWTYLIARIVYVVVYLIGIPVARTLSFVVGLLATLYLYVLAL